MTLQERDDLILANLSIAPKTAYSLIRRFNLVGVRDDMLGEANLQLVHAASTFNPALGTPFKAYAFTFIYHRLIDYMRSSCFKLVGNRHHSAETLSMNFFSETDRNELLTATAKNQLTTDTLAQATENKDQVDKFLNTIVRPRDKDVVVKVYLQGQTMKSVGKQISVNESRVSHLCARAIKDYREQVVAWRQRNVFP